MKAQIFHLHPEQGSPTSCPSYFDVIEQFGLEAYYVFDCLRSWPLDLGIRPHAGQLLHAHLPLPLHLRDHRLLCPFEKPQHRPGRGCHPYHRPGGDGRLPQQGHPVPAAPEGLQTQLGDHVHAPCVGAGPLRAGEKKRGECGDPLQRPPALARLHHPEGRVVAHVHAGPGPPAQGPPGQAQAAGREVRAAAPAAHDGHPRRATAETGRDEPRPRRPHRDRKAHDRHGHDRRQVSRHGDLPGRPQPGIAPLEGYPGIPRFVLRRLPRLLHLPHPQRLLGSLPRDEETRHERRQPARGAPRMAQRHLPRGHPGAVQGRCQLLRPDAHHRALVQSPRRRLWQRILR